MVVPGIPFLVQSDAGNLLVQLLGVASIRQPPNRILSNRYGELELGPLTVIFRRRSLKVPWSLETTLAGIENVSVR
jgi:hypothetical protein